MDQIETILVSGRIVAEFGDDASQFLSGEAEFVGIPEKKGVTPSPTRCRRKRTWSHQNRVSLLGRLAVPEGTPMARQTAQGSVPN